ncbi:MAG: 50S ribosomal protein L33 [Metamycoplasmataceae bacterium]
MKKITLSCDECKNKNYYLNKSTNERLKIRKFCKKCNGYSIHKEEK